MNEMGGGSAAARRSLKDVLKDGIDFLAVRAIESPVVLAERLLEGALSCKRHDLYLDAERTLPEAAVKIYFEYLRQRAGGMPCQYILGEAPFMDFSFRVSPDVLIPRPETEFLVEKVLSTVKSLGLSDAPLDLLDVGTGSGNIAVSLAVYLAQARVCAVDVSEAALAIARQNAERNNAGGRIEFLISDFFRALPRNKLFDSIVANPPYLSRKEMEALANEVRYEPSGALFGGERGTEAIARLVPGARDFLKPEGFLSIEIGWEQGDEVRKIFEKAGYRDVEVHRDYCGRDRVVKGFKS